MHARLQKDNYRKMKRIGAIILSTAVAASMIAGCTKQITDTDPTGLSTNSTAAATSASADNSVSETDPQTPQSFEELYANQLVTFLDHQYYYDGEAIPTTESNFYFINSFLDLSGYAQMGYYPATNLGYIDLAADFSGDGYNTFGDYFIEYAENSIESTCILCARAKAENITLSDDTRKDIDAMFEDIKTTKAADSGMSLDEYLQFYYGPGNDEAHFRATLERYYLADAYTREYCKNYEFSDEEKNIPYIRYALFYAPETAEQSAKDQALSEATTMKDACSSIDDLTGLAQTAQENGLVYDQGDIAVPKGQMVPKFEEWAYGEGRTVGELDIIYAPEYGYFVVGYLGLQEQSSDVLDQYAMQQLSEEILAEIDEGKHDFHTNDAFLPAPEGPTATPLPDYAIPSEGVTFDPNSTTATEYNGSTGGNTTTTDVLIVVFLTLAGVAIAAVIVILVVSAVKNNKNGSSVRSSKKYYSDEEDDYEDDENPLNTGDDEDPADNGVIVEEPDPEGSGEDIEE